MKLNAESGLLLLALLYFLRPNTPHSPNASTGVKHEANRTPLTSQAFRAALRRGFEGQEGREPTSAEEAMLLAHSAAETGRWKSMYGFNPGFVTTAGGVDYFAGSDIDPANPLLFRWYADIDAGVKDWLYVLQRDWPDAWAHLDGDVFGYVEGLFKGAHGSYFGDASVYPKYQKLVNALFNEFSAWTSLGPDKASKAADRGSTAAPSMLPVAWRRSVGTSRRKR